ncbi:hypothetical protein P170DRAFT_474423 [Aspergillus steynii IBT 23096]|uniref:Uncharacterized protein n=1 Tax=Aspergillus steynii IBT 23096 TaxID=1392250 RepID=A0A2I2GDA3_9EURO|nr:uncharacterized protein P170DRAFT_474423 [Aspergillus steynii IBT 23096]PLB50876.1 hypothetical protein P170DRAFT_474423 [Aspergillus steynii IBT 23096]
MFYTDIIIDAVPSVTRDAFLNFSALSLYHSSYYQSITLPDQAPARPGDKLICTIDSIPYPAIVEVNSPREFTWRGYLIWNWIFNGLHSFKFEKHGNQTRFVQCEELGGLLGGVLEAVARDRMLDGFRRFNNDFKCYVEGKEEGL